MIIFDYSNNQLLTKTNYNDNTKQNKGSYKGETIVNGYKIRLEVDTIEDKGFSFSYYVNNKLMYDDGWYGLRLKDIKEGIKNNIKICIEDYESNKGV